MSEGRKRGGRKKIRHIRLCGKARGNQKKRTRLAIYKIRALGKLFTGF